MPAYSRKSWQMKGLINSIENGINANRAIVFLYCIVFFVFFMNDTFDNVISPGTMWLFFSFPNLSHLTMHSLCVCVSVVRFEIEIFRSLTQIHFGFVVNAKP